MASELCQQTTASSLALMYCCYLCTEGSTEVNHSDCMYYHYPALLLCYILISHLNFELH